MNPRTTAVLFVVVALLGGLAWWQLREEAANPTGTRSRPLFEGFDPGRVVAVRVDNLERDVQVRLRRSEGGRWDLVDPIEYPADAGVVKGLLEVGVHNAAVPADGVDPARVGLDPPRAVLELEQTGEAARTHRLELGALDVDGHSVYVRVDGEVLRTLQTVDASLERDLDSWRSRTVLPIGVGQVIDLQRSGTVREGDELLDVELVAQRDPATNRWMGVRPFGAALDPDFVQLYLLRLTTLQVEAFVEDAPLSLEPYGLDEPELVLRVGTLRGERHELHFAQPSGRTWFCRREGQNHVWRIDAPSMTILAAEAESLIDGRILRAPRETVVGVVLEREAGTLSLRRRGVLWEVSTDADPIWRRADTGRVEDLLAVLETETLGAPLPSVELAAGDVVAAFRVETEAGEVLGGEIGGPAALEGAGGRAFRRLGDQLVMLGGDTLLELARTPAADLRSLHVVRLSEAEQSRVRLSGGDGATQRSFVRENDGLWRPEGVQLEALAFARLVDRLLSVKALELIDPPGAPLADEVRVEVVDKLGDRTAYRLGRVEGVEGDVWESGGAWARLAPGRLDEVSGILTGR